MTHVLALPAGTELVGEYRIERVLGAGGFGITYLAQETALARDVTIKEYFPGDFAARSQGHDAVPKSQDCAGDYEWGLERFISEAQILARFDHKHIVRVFRYFRANNTGYMVLQFEEGASLKSWLKGLRRAPRQKELDKVLAPMLDALEIIHKSDFLHRDIAPDNIIIRKDGTPVLIDFGSARGDIARQSRTVSALVKPGYSPYEQYAETGRQQGPWTDIYALGATLYHAVTGKRPPDAPSRVVKDELIPAREAAISSYRPGFLAAIDQALALDIEKRPQSVAQWRGTLFAPEPRKAGWLQRTMGLRREPANDDPLVGATAGPPEGAVPPPPDAPGAQGRLLDYIDRLKKQSAPPRPPGPIAPIDSEETAAAAPPRPADSAGNATLILAKPPAPAERKASRPAAPAKARKKPVRRVPRPKRVKTGDERSWWPMALKLVVGAIVATAAVGFQDQLPALINGTSHTPTGAVREIERPRAAMSHPGGANAVAFTDDGRWIVSIGADGLLRVWEADSGTPVRSLELDAGRATSLAVSGRRGLTGHADGSAVLWDLERGERIGRFRRNEASIWSVSFMGAGRILASGHDWALSVWDARNNSAPALVIEAHDNAAQAVAYSARGAHIASGGADRLVKLWDAESGSPIRTYRGHRDFISAVAFSPDGRILASAAHDGSIRLWSTGSHRLFRALARHSGRVGGLAFSPSGAMLASAGDDGVVRLWDFRRARILRTYSDGAAGLRAIAFSPDGRRLAAASESGAVRIWDLPATVAAR